MELYPAIDLHSGQCVRLYQGAFDQLTSYGNDPLAVAQHFQSEGAKYLHLVDLEGAKKGAPVHLEVIREIAQNTDLQIQVGGGIRDITQIEQLFDLGVKRVILGSIAISQSALVTQWLYHFGAEKIVLAFDIRMDQQGMPYLASHGWQSDTSTSLWDILEVYAPCALKHVLCTDIACDGTLQGPNVALYQQCQKRYPQVHFQASGGVSRLADLQKLAHIPVAGVIIGKALYEKRFSLSEAYFVLKK